MTGTLSIVELGSNGRFTLRNLSSSATNVIVDVEGWYDKASASETAPSYNPTISRLRASWDPRDAKLADVIKNSIAAGWTHLPTY